jgi:hypothetical protein
MTLIQYYAKSTGKKEEEITIDELKILGISLEFFIQFQKQNKVESKSELTKVE